VAKKRVHELAKEFKISTAALKQHLSDMGIVVKSHMSPVEDEVVAKIREKFDQVGNQVKKRQQDIRNLHAQVEKKKKSAEKKVVKKPEKKPTNQKEAKSKKAAPVFVEKEIKKAKPKKFAAVKPDIVRRAPAKPDVSEQIKKKARSTKVVPIPPTADKKFSKRDKKKFDEKEFETKNKHIKAKQKKISKKKKSFNPSELQAAEIKKNIQKTLQKKAKKKRYKKDSRNVDVDTKITVSEFTSVAELAKMMGINPSEIIKKFFMMGQMVTINQRLDKDSLEMICAEMDFDVEFQEEFGKDMLKETEIKREDAEAVPRPPIVTVMGHVDHGKTAILDRIRQTNVVAGESGGITQHIGAYQITYKENKITFLDTPGHEAFAAMRARGANVTDLAVIVVAANESVKKQTVEAIDHAKAAGVQLIVAINKIDLPEANVERTINDLMTHGLYLENYGGEVLWCQTSAMTGEGIDELLDTILLSSEIMELEAPQDVAGRGIVIESQKDSRKGVMATVLLQEGTLSKGDNIVCGANSGRVRKMENEREVEIELMEASDVAVIYGLSGVPKSGDILNKVEDEKTARQISNERQNIRKEREKFQAKTNLDNLFQRIKEDNMNEVKLIVKGDTDGSVGALCDSFQKLSTDEVMVNIIRSGVGGINEADVNLASASDALIVGFHVRTNNPAKKLAEDENVQIKIFQIIYEAIDVIKKAMSGLLDPEDKEVYLGTAEIKQVFKIKGVGQIAGVRVVKGKITNSGKVRIYRNDIMVHEGNLSSLKHYSDEVKEVKAGSEGGIGIENYNDLKEGDVIENFVIEQVERTI
jgi:translation initiation factor IF-2